MKTLEIMEELNHFSNTGHSPLLTSQIITPEKSQLISTSSTTPPKLNIKQKTEEWWLGSTTISFLLGPLGDKFSQKISTSPTSPNLHQGNHSHWTSQKGCSHFGSRPGANFTPPGAPKLELSVETPKKKPHGWLENSRFLIGDTSSNSLFNSNFAPEKQWDCGTGRRSAFPFESWSLFRRHSLFFGEFCWQK